MMKTLVVVVPPRPKERFERHRKLFEMLQREGKLVGKVAVYNATPIDDGGGQITADFFAERLGCKSLLISEPVRGFPGAIVYEIVPQAYSSDTSTVLVVIGSADGGELLHRYVMEYFHGEAPRFDGEKLPPGVAYALEDRKHLSTRYPT